MSAALALALAVSVLLAALIATLDRARRLKLAAVKQMRMIDALEDVIRSQDEALNARAAEVAAKDALIAAQRDLIGIHEGRAPEARPNVH